LAGQADTCTGVSDGYNLVLIRIVELWNFERVAVSGTGLLVLSNVDATPASAVAPVVVGCIRIEAFATSTNFGTPHSQSGIGLAHGD
jgi:hypothetical protein